MKSCFDVVVIGAGPAGSAVGALLAARGLEVGLFERRAFPRFHVGESLVPAVNLTLAKLGVLEQMDGHRFPRKHGVQFFSHRGPSRPFYFSEVDDERLHHTWQVLRSDFDALLLAQAVRAGAESATETEVLDVHAPAGTVEGVRVRDADGAERTVEARVVVDASGQRGALAARFGGRDHIPGLANTSFYAHYAGAVLDDGIDAGSTLIYRLDSASWLWFIPLPDAVSVGLVAPARRVAELEGSPAEILDDAIASCALLSERLAGARRTTKVRPARDYTYRANRDGGAGWLLVGDALGFIDPIYSTGLFLTMFSAELAADAIAEALRPETGAPDLAGYARDYQAAFDQFLVLVRAFYREDFRFGEFARQKAHRRGLVDLLTGIVGTPAAIEVADALRAFCGDERDMTRRA